VGELVVYYL
jgi:hypothetical protein